MDEKVVLVTGANRGIGFAIVQALASKSPANSYLLGCRDKAKGIVAIQKLHSLGVKSKFDVIELDVTSDDSIQAAETEVRTRHGRLDVLINNAGIGLLLKADHSDLREVYGKVLDANITSPARVMSTFLPLLREAPDGRVINISSARASFEKVASPGFPPTVSIPYGVSKAALNMLTLEYGKAPGNECVTFHSASPGHCKTEFNGFRGTKDPVDGAKVVVGLALAAEGKYPGGFYQMEGDEAEPTIVPW